jgi:putative membrane protein insertion efficiency factor/ribonuclease P protein component
MKGTIKSKDQITELFAHAEKFSAASMMALFLPVGCGTAKAAGRGSASEALVKPAGRVAYIAGKKLGTAPLRNRAKRRLREAAVLQGAPWSGYDVVLVARKGAVEKDFTAVRADIARFANKLNQNTPNNQKQTKVAQPQLPALQKKSVFGQILGFIHNIPKNIALGCITIYRHAISPIFPPSCRYIPTCSEYAFEAFRRYGFVRGFGMAVRRVGRCHPWHEGGYDPVP